MDPIESNLKYIYHLLVIVKHDFSYTQWRGKLTLISQENGETVTDLSFTDQPVLSASQDRSCNHSVSGLSIVCIAQERFYEPIPEDDTGGDELEIAQPIGLSISSFVDQKE